MTPYGAPRERRLEREREEGGRVGMPRRVPYRKGSGDPLRGASSASKGRGSLPCTRHASGHGEREKQEIERREEREKKKKE